jgi:hypothetical protein
MLTPLKLCLHALTVSLHGTYNSLISSKLEMFLSAWTLLIFATSAFMKDFLQVPFCVTLNHTMYMYNA